MKIIEKIEKIKVAIENDPEGNASLGERLRKYGCLAVQQGINSRAWQEYMRIFASNPDQLKRLIGEDETFNASLWGPTTLAYLVANGCCGIDTGGNTRRGMSEAMEEVLDSGNLNSEDHQNFV